MTDHSALGRRSTDKKVRLHARAEDYPPTQSEIEGTDRVRVKDALNPHGSVRLPGGLIVEATCEPGFIGDRFVRSFAELDPEKVTFDE